VLRHGICRRNPTHGYCEKYQCSIERRIQLFRAVCEAVLYAHQHAVIYRDLKPSNILVKNDGSVRLLDFGIAKQIDSLDATVDQTLTGLRLMTPAYAAPEQVRGDRVGIHTDVYSLGVILYELLSGQLPFDLTNLTPGEAATIIAGHEPGKPSVITKQSKSLPSTISARQSLTKAEWADSAWRTCRGRRPSTWTPCRNCLAGNTALLVQFALFAPSCFRVLPSMKGVCFSSPLHVARQRGWRSSELSGEPWLKKRTDQAQGLVRKGI